MLNRIISLSAISVWPLMLAIGAIGLAPTASRANPSPGSYRAGSAASITRDLHQPSPAEDFFRQGRLQFEREIQQVAQQQPVVLEDLLKINPDPREFQPHFNPRLEAPKQQQPPASPTPQ